MKNWERHFHSDDIVIKDDHVYRPPREDFAKEIDEQLKIAAKVVAGIPLTNVEDHKKWWRHAGNRGYVIQPRYKDHNLRLTSGGHRVLIFARTLNDIEVKLGLIREANAAEDFDDLLRQVEERLPDT